MMSPLLSGAEPLGLENMFAKIKAVAPARIYIERNFDKSVRASVAITTVDIFPDESASAISFYAQHPEQQTLYFLGENRIVRYQSGVLGKNGKVEPASPGKLVLTSFVNPRRGIWDHPAAEAFQLNLAKYLEGISVGVSDKGDFSYSDSDKKFEIKGRFLSSNQFFSVFTHAEDKKETTYSYSNPTNFNGNTLHQSMTLTVRQMGKIVSESRYSFRFEKANQLLHPSINLNPPLGTLVTDERFSPSLTYYADKDKYSKEDLALLHNVQGDKKGAIVQSEGAPSPIQWFQWIGLLLVFVIPMIAFLIVRRRQNHG